MAFKLSNLKLKKESKRNKDFIFAYNENDAKAPRINEDEPAEVEPIEIGANEEHIVTFKDTRKSSLADREHILRGIKRPVENQLIRIISPEKKRDSPEENDAELNRDLDEAVANDKLESIIREEAAAVVEDTAKPDNMEESEESEESHDVIIKKPRAKKSKKTDADDAFEKYPPFDLTVERIGKLTASERLPVKQRLTVGVSAYYMNNRKIYISQLSRLFKKYSDKIAAKSAELSCATLQNTSVDFDLLTHQLVIRDYLNLYTPYRGLLLYHGLGSGKTCTSIGVAEGMKSGKSIVLMTPASLKMNFFNELKKCGDVLYKKNQFWEFVPVSGDTRMLRVLSQSLGLDTEYIRANGGAWMVNIKKRANFGSLSDADQKAVDEQLNAMIRNKYIDINYNGLRTSHLDEMTKGGKVNPFDNKVVIIDEAHNLVSRIANTGSSKDTIAYRLYNDLMDATNAKIIFLSGTPIINTPREIGILFNMLRGYIKTWTFNIQTTTSDKVNTEIIMEYLREGRLITYDYVDYSSGKLTITRNPFGFVNVYEKDRKTVPRKGGKTKATKKRKITSHKKTKRHAPIKEQIYNDDDVVMEDLDDIEIDKMYRDLEKGHYEGGSEATASGVTVFGNFAGGSAYDEYSGVKLDEMGNISDSEFQKRLASILADHGLRIIGKPTIKKEKCLPDTEELFDELFINGEKGELIQSGLLKRRILGLTSYFRSAQEQLLPSFVKDEEGANYHIVNIDMSDHQFELYETVRKEERDEESRNKKKRGKKGKGDDGVEKPTSSYRIYSRSACNFAFPAEHPRPLLTASKKDFDAFNAVTKQMKKSDDEYFEEDDDEVVGGSSYENDTINIFEESENTDGGGGKKKVVINEPDKDVVAQEAMPPPKKRAPKKVAAVEEEVSAHEIIDYEKRIHETYDFLAYDPKRSRAKEYLTESELGTYSPKFAEILRNIMNEENRGLHLLYSQFRTLEGIGIFKLILEANGFAEFKLVKKGREWEIENWDVDPEKPRFVLYTGTESAEEKDIARNIYNGAWDIVPPSIVEQLRKRNSNNLYGEIIKVMMITASGAEGINLRNTRFVHIMEPYWNMVRVDQVVGRARRICSHEDLPEDMRNVKVMIYLCRATKPQIDKNIELRTKDLSKLTYSISGAAGSKKERVPFTTDQYLFEIAQIKDSITKQILKAVKETAIDCSLYNSSSDENLVCYGFGEVEKQSFASYPMLERDAQEKEVERKVQVKLVAITENDIKYALNRESLVVYDFASYLNAKEKRGQLMAVGVYDMRTRKIVFDKV